MFSSSDKDVTFSLKVMINKEKTKVLFVEGDSDFVDVLLSFLTLPLGMIGQVLEKHYGDKAPVIGNLNTLFNGLSNLDTVHFQNESCKQMLLNPRSSFSDECRDLKIDIIKTQPIEYFSCEDEDCGVSNLGMYYGTTKCRCGRSLNREVKRKASAKDSCKFFTSKAASLIISDDMRVAPNVEGSILKTLSNLGITETQGATLRQVKFGFNEIMELLKRMIVSKSPLTDIILGKTKGRSANPKFEPAGNLSHNTEKVVASNSKKMILKVMVQKSTNKLLFAQAGEDFVDFLFSLLTIPLGGVAYLLESNTCLANVDNIYKSLASISGSKYFKTEEIKTRLLNPELPYGYISNGQILPLVEEPHPVVYFFPKSCTSSAYLSTTLMDYDSNDSEDDLDAIIVGSVSYLNSPTSKGNYVKGVSMFMVTDDLTVTPLCMFTTLSILSELEIPLADVKEVEMLIGLKEALNILKASLTSTCALTDGLLNPFFVEEMSKARKLRPI